MAQEGDYKAPPALTKDITFICYLEKGNKHLATFYIIREKKHAPAIFLSLSGQVCEVVSKLELNKLNDDNGIKNLLEKLDKLYLTHSAYEAYERFETFSRVPSVTVSDYIFEFERLYNKAKQHKMELHHRVLAFWFLHSATISSHHK